MEVGRSARARPAPVGAGSARRTLATVFRLAVVVAALWTAWRLASNGALVFPMSLFDAAASTRGLFAATHLVPVAAATIGGAALAGLLDGGWWLPRWPVTVGVLLPLAAYALASLHAVDPFDARTALLIACAWTGAFFALVDALAGARLWLPSRGRHAAGATAPAAGAVAPTGGALRVLVLAAVALGGLRIAWMGLAQFHAGVPTEIAWTGIKVAAVIPVRAHAAFQNPNVFASACLLFFGCGAALVLRPGRGPARLLAWVSGLAVVVAATAALVLSFSRAAYVALVLACLLLLLLLPRGARRQVVPVLLGVIVPFGLLAAAVPGVVFRIHAIGVASGGDVESRFFSWLDALRVWGTYRLLGAGPQGIQPLYAPFFPLQHFGTYDLINVPGGIDNDPLQWLAETGLVGAAALLTGACVWIAAAWRAWGRLPAARRAVLAPLAGVLVALVAQSLLETTLLMLPVEALVTVVAALWFAEADLVWRAALPRGAAAVAACLGAAVPLAAGALMVVALHRPWSGDQAYLDGWSLMGKDSLSTAAADFQRAGSLQPQDPRNWAALADTQLLAAYQLRDKPNAAERSEVARARAALDRALAIDPYDAATWDLAALWEGLTGHPLAQACGEQRAVRDNAYDTSFILKLAEDLAVLSRAPGEPALLAGPYAAASLRDTGYAARLLPLVLDVYKEHKFIGGIPTVEKTEARALATWRTAAAGALPTLPALPIAAATCRAAVTTTGLPWPAVPLPPLPHAGARSPVGVSRG